MAKMKDLLVSGWEKIEQAELLLEAHRRDPNYDHFTAHCCTAYEYYGHPFYCASIGDTMGNVIRQESMKLQARKWMMDNVFPREGCYHETEGAGLHNQHVIDFRLRYAKKVTLLDVSRYVQIYEIPIIQGERP